MHRAITALVQDLAGDWIAILVCGHRQHVRHRPPFADRSWVESREGRELHLGQDLECPLCARFEWPADFEPYKRTPEFSAATIPAGLLKDHSTKKGVWAKIVVLEGGLRYTVDALNATFILDRTTTGTVQPEVLHHIAPLGAVRFYVEFYRTKV
ncbi:MAG: DUF3565 domain-containing protein [Gammaproteobacteria bacterium]|nr:DUF3565 domain-containing protein [Gammaproteobacteria bacterium]